MEESQKTMSEEQECTSKRRSRNNTLREKRRMRNARKCRQRRRILKVNQIESLKKEIQHQHSLTNGMEKKLTFIGVCQGLAGNIGSGNCSKDASL